MLHTNQYTAAVTPENIYAAQNNDTQLNKLAHLICAGKAPTNDPALKPYNKIFTELTISDGGLIMKGHERPTNYLAARTIC